MPRSDIGQHHHVHSRNVKCPNCHKSGHVRYAPRKKMFWCSDCKIHFSRFQADVAEQEMALGGLWCGKLLERGIPLNTGAPYMYV